MQAVSRPADPAQPGGKSGSCLPPFPGQKDGTVLLLITKGLRPKNACPAARPKSGPADPLTADQGGEEGRRGGRSVICVPQHHNSPLHLHFVTHKTNKVRERCANYPNVPLAVLCSAASRRDSRWLRGRIPAFQRASHPNNLAKREEKRYPQDGVPPTEPERGTRGGPLIKPCSSTCRKGVFNWRGNTLF